MITQEKLDQYLELKDEIEAAALEIAWLWGKAKGWSYFPDWSVGEIGSSEISYSAYYSGDTDYLSLPIQYLLAEDPEPLMRTDLEKERREQEVARQKKEQADEARERQHYERLKQKYGDG